MAFSTLTHNLPKTYYSNKNCVMNSIQDILGFLPNGAPKLVRIWKCSCGMNASIVPQNMRFANGIPVDFDSSDEEEETEQCPCCLAKDYRKKGIQDINKITCQTCYNWKGNTPF